MFRITWDQNVNIATEFSGPTLDGNWLKMR